MSKLCVCSFSICAVCLFIISTPLSAAEPQLPGQVLDWQKAAQDSLAQDNSDDAIESYQKITQAFPNTAYAMRAQAGIAIAYLKANKTADADTAVQKLLTDYENYPDIAKCIREVSTAYISANQPTQSKQLCQTILSKWPNYTDMVLIQRNLAMAYVQLGEFTEAQTATAKLLKSYSGHSELPKGIRKIAYCYFKAQRPDEAKELCQMALSTWPNDSEAILTRRDLAINHIRLGEYEEAESVTARLIADYANHAEIGNCIGRIASYYFTPKKPEKAKQLCQLALSNWPDHSDKAKTLSTLADALIKLGEIKQANEVTANLIEGYSDCTEIGGYVRKAAFYYLEHGQPLQARELYQTVLDKWPQTQDVVLAQAGLAAACLQLDDTASTETATNTLLSDFTEHKDFASAISWLADQYFKSDNSTKAMELYEYVLSLNPCEDIQLCCKAAIAQIYVRLGDDAKVQEKVDYLLSNYKKNPEVLASRILDIGEEYYLKAQKVSGKGNAAEAKATYEKAIAILETSLDMTSTVPNRCSAYYVTGLSYRELGDYVKAADALQKAYQADPAFKYADYCLFEYVRCYGRLAESGKVSHCEAFYNSYLSLNELNALFPGSKYIPPSQHWLVQCTE